jgi:hypothetical protein
VKFLFNFSFIFFCLRNVHAISISGVHTTNLPYTWSVDLLLQRRLSFGLDVSVILGLNLAVDCGLLSARPKDNRLCKSKSTDQVYGKLEDTVKRNGKYFLIKMSFLFFLEQKSKYSQTCFSDHLY